MRNFFKIVFMGYRKEVELTDCSFFNKKTFYLNDNIIISKGSTDIIVSDKDKQLPSFQK